MCSNRSRSTNDLGHRLQINFQIFILQWICYILNNFFGSNKFINTRKLSGLKLFTLSFHKCIHLINLLFTHLQIMFQFVNEIILSNNQACNSLFIRLHNFSLLEISLFLLVKLGYFFKEKLFFFIFSGIEYFILPQENSCETFENLFKLER